MKLGYDGLGRIHMYFYCQFYCNIFYLTLPLPYPFLMKDGKVELDSRSGDGARGVGEGGGGRGGLGEDVTYMYIIISRSTFFKSI